MLGCGPAVEETGTASGSGTSGPSTSGGTTGTSSTGSAEVGSSGDETGSVCPELRNGETPNLIVPVEITNTLATPVYVGYESTCLVDLFELTRPDGSIVDWRGRFCTPTCQEVMAGECFDCGACPETAMLRIGPGATYTYEWTPLEYDLLDVPAECNAQPCSSTCDRRYPLPDGGYTLQIVASTGCDGDGMTCECWDGQDACEVYPWSWPEVTHSASVQFSVPTSGALSLTIQ